MGTVTRMELRKIDELHPYERNAKLHPPEQIEKLRASFREFGMIVPVGIDGQDRVIYGHGRLLAAQAEGWTEVPTVTIEDLSEEQRQAFVHADNLLGETGYDKDILKSEAHALQAAGFDITLVGFEAAGIKIDGFVTDLTPPQVCEDDYDAEPPEEPRTTRGEIYQLGEHLLMCGDSTYQEDVLSLMRKERAQMVFTDPPWNVNYGASDHPTWKPRSILNDSMSTADFRQFMDSTFCNMNLVSEPGAMTYVVMSAQEWGNMMLSLYEAHYHWSSTIIWNKDSLVLSRKDYHTKYEPIWYGWKDGAPRLYPLEDRKQSDVWDFDRPKKSIEHPTMKPVGLVARAIENSSVKDSLVLDLFGGSGTTLIACEQLGRKCRMMELDPGYCDVIINRWEKFTGQKAELLKD